ncbi:2-hydroxyacid dehydrogenase [uncultured Sphingomonas sp.]|uniref:2-hydroxyacid dehydrogenase n=1 Tax=uncultured Sphingomonas sp. TaxID=158754 RepID=UPI0025DD2C7A|nr:2-hydroxyacid dehydrogenase [uncultured Sphingomonas sp.]
MRAMPHDLFLATAIPPALDIALAERFTIHRDTAPPTTRAIVGGGMMTVDAALLDRLPELEIIAIHGVGHDGIDHDAVAARGIRVAITADILTEDVADQAIALWLAVDRRVAANDRAMRMGNWTVPLGRRASGRRIGIFGLGRIGQAIAKRAEPFGGEILYTARSEKPVAWRFLPDLATLAAESDVLFLAAPGGDETRGMVDADVLDRLGVDGVLVNVARGSLVDEDALIAALEAHRIAGAGLDVFADEPDVPYALRRMNHVVLAPHQGSATREGRAAMAEMVVANLEAHFAGREVPGLLA